MSTIREADTMIVFVADNARSHSPPRRSSIPDLIDAVEMPEFFHDSVDLLDMFDDDSSSGASEDGFDSFVTSGIFGTDSFCNSSSSTLARSNVTRRKYIAPYEPSSPEQTEMDRTSHATSRWATEEISKPNRANVNDVSPARRGAPVLPSRSRSPMVPPTRRVRSNNCPLKMVRRQKSNDRPFLVIRSNSSSSSASLTIPRVPTRIAFCSKSA